MQYMHGFYSHEDMVPVAVQRCTCSAGSPIGVLSNASSLTALRKLREGLPLPCFNGFRFCTGHRAIRINSMDSAMHDS